MAKTAAQIARELRQEAHLLMMVADMLDKPPRQRKSSPKPAPEEEKLETAQDMEDVATEVMDAPPWTPEKIATKDEVDRYHDAMAERHRQGKEPGYY